MRQSGYSGLRRRHHRLTKLRHGVGELALQAVIAERGQRRFQVELINPPTLPFNNRWQRRRRVDFSRGANDQQQVTGGNDALYFI